MAKRKRNSWGKFILMTPNGIASAKRYREEEARRNSGIVLSFDKSNTQDPNTPDGDENIPPRRK